MDLHLCPVSRETDAFYCLIMKRDNCRPRLKLQVYYPESRREVAHRREVQHPTQRWRFGSTTLGVL
jgi:hypothetical protein